jgi:class 3 adenylate cyclase/DNA-binding response OmpR family regulator
MEDSDIFADMVMEFLSLEGYEARRAVNGFEGIKQVYAFMPHLVISDVEMPLFKGYQVTRLLKSRKSTRPIPVIMFTTLSENKDKFWGSQAGADLYLEKTPENFAELRHNMEKLMGENPEPDFTAIAREGKRINDGSLIEMVNNLLDRKLFQTTLIGMLAELSSKIKSLEDIVRGIFDLLHNICEAEIVSVMIKGSENSLFVYGANFGGFNGEISDDFTAISIADFDGLFRDFQVVERTAKDFFPPGKKSKKMESYIMIPLSVGGENFATVHIANSMKEYFSPAIVENINVFLAAAAPVISNALSVLEMENLQRKTRAAFARYVPADVMDDIIRRSSETAGQGESRNGVILFSDIRNFTAISENSTPQDLVSFLNSFFSLMGNEIIAEGGHIDKFIGDEIMAVFGVIRNLPDSPTAAIRAGVRMIAALKKVDTSRITLPEKGLAMGVGINYGECVVGNIGFHDKMDYTLIGDNVNLASRLQGITKIYHHPLIVSEYVYQAAKDAFIFRKIDDVRVVGKEEAVGTYAVYTSLEGGTTAEGCPEVPSLVINRELLDNYNKGFRLFRMREWETAREYFAGARDINRYDYLSALYLDRCTEYLKNPPPADWDPAATLTKK